MSNRQRQFDTTKPDLAVFRAPEHGIDIYGEIKLDDDVCAIDGIAVGLTQEKQYSFRPSELSGHSSERGQVWLERILVPSSSCPMEGARPGTIRIQAHTMFWGEFDPRSTPIDRAELSLENLAPLAVKTPARLQAEGEASFFENGSEELFQTDTFRLSIVGRYENEINLSAQALVVDFTTPQPHTAALQLLEQWAFTFLPA